MKKLYPFLMHTSIKAVDSPIDLDLEQFGWSLSHVNNSINEFKRSESENLSPSIRFKDSSQDMIDNLFCHFILFTLFLYCFSKAIYELLLPEFRSSHLLKPLFSIKMDSLGLFPDKILQFKS